MAKKAAVRTASDTLSRLPDELLLLIISLLPMKDVVRSSVLSKRWRYLFASRSDLDFDFTKDSVSMDAVDRVFFYRKSCPIQKFRFWCSKFEAFDPFRLEGWIKCVMCHGIREIELSIDSGLVLPSNLFTCETLVELSLSVSTGRFLEVPAKVFLPSLKVLSLNSVVSFHKDDNGVERLFSNCPALESFNCSIRDDECRLIVSSPTLKFLQVDKRRSTHEETHSLEIVINAPNLVRLSYTVFNVESHRLINVQSLSQASVSFFPPQGNVDNYVLAATDLITGISGVHTLNIDGCTLDVSFQVTFPFREEELIKNFLGLNIPIPVFHNTTFLEIYASALRSFADLLYVLTFFESLETLSLEEPPFKFDLDDGYELEESRASCLSFRLKRICFSGFKGDECEMKMVEYFLENAKVLELLETDIVDRDCKEELEITKKLLMLPRASEKCKVVVSSLRMDEEDYE